MLGLFVFRPIVYKPLWDTFVFRFEFYETVSFLSSLEVLPRTTDPYLWISDSKWRIFLTYLGISSKWRDFLPFRKNPQSTSSIFPLFVLGFIPIFVLDEFLPKSETILHHMVIRARLFLFRIRFELSFSNFSHFWFCRVGLVHWVGFLVVRFCVLVFFSIQVVVVVFILQFVSCLGAAVVFSSSSILARCVLSIWLNEKHINKMAATCNLFGFFFL